MAALNENPLNKASWKRLKEARESPPPHHLYLLSLAAWGLENKVQGEWPDRDRPAVQQQVDGLFGWKQENAMAWLLSNPNGPSKSDQAASLLQELRGASSPQSAAASVLNLIYSRQQAENPALQPAASELR
jgi:hypothetical protein